MKNTSSGNQVFKQEMVEIINDLDMPESQKRFMKSRWLDQVLWLEKRATSSRDRFYQLRMATIIGGVVIPAFVSLNIGGKAGDTLRWATFGISQLVAISAAVEEFFRYGDRWQQYRNTAEGLKIEGWQFFQLSGPYRNSQSHSLAYNAFATRVEYIIRKDVSVYISEILEKKDKSDDKEQKEEKDKKEEKEVVFSNGLKAGNS
ncbi:DUF4231 domain-containing protein [Aerosakkonemataceae cyanobacterium BLCC-F154]|uniref:DUF4231 domain-containing protein n=1 Tax=Floridaenema fluviatile BLCC-F154 TaxID=3153640 RepID=A0ABV4YKK1_9CYAN